MQLPQHRDQPFHVAGDQRMVRRIELRRADARCHAPQQVLVEGGAREWSFGHQSLQFCLGRGAHAARTAGGRLAQRCDGRGVPDSPQRLRRGGAGPSRSQRRQPVALLQRVLQRANRVRSAERSERLDRAEVDEREMRVRSRWRTRWQKSGRGALVAHRRQFADQRLFRSAAGRFQRLQQDLRRRFAAAPHQRLNRFALNQRLAVGQQRLQLPQSLGTAEFAQQVRCRASGLPSSARSSAAVPIHAPPRRTRRGCRASAASIARPVRPRGPRRAAGSPPARCVGQAA